MAPEQAPSVRRNEPPLEPVAEEHPREPASRAPRSHLRVHLPASTILKVLFAALLVYVLFQLWTPFLVFLLAVLIAISVDPLVQRLERLKLSRGLAVGTVSAIILACGAVFVLWILPPLVQQVTLLAENYSDMRVRILRDFPENWPVMKKVVEQVLALPDSPEVAQRFSGSVYWGRLVVGIFSVTIVVLALSTYLLVDGRRMYAWLVCYVPRRHRGKIAEAMPEVTAVVRAYVRAQILTSVICGLTVYAAMRILGVPGALPLALLAALLNVIPVIGSIVMAVPAAVLALAVSPATAALVIAFHVTYNLVETYLIIPKVFGKSLRLSTLAVLLALLAGGILQGVLGAFLILPLVAAYPIIERIWLGRYLGTDTVKDHKALVAVQGGGARSEQRTVETVLRGDPHRREDLVSEGTEAERALVGAPEVSTRARAPRSTPRGKA